MNQVKPPKLCICTSELLLIFFSYLATRSQKTFSSFVCTHLCIWSVLFRLEKPEVDWGFNRGLSLKLRRIMCRFTKTENDRDFDQKPAIQCRKGYKCILNMRLQLDRIQYKCSKRYLQLPQRQSIRLFFAELRSPSKILSWHTESLCSLYLQINVMVLFMLLVFIVCIFTLTVNAKKQKNRHKSTKSICNDLPFPDILAGIFYFVLFYFTNSDILLQPHIALFLLHLLHSVFLAEVD